MPSEVVLGIEIARDYGRAGFLPYPRQTAGASRLQGIIDVSVPFYQMPFDEAKRKIVDLVRQVLDVNKLAAAQVRSIGVALTDPVSQAGDLDQGTQHPRWQNLSVADELRHALQTVLTQEFTIAIGNDANLSALAEYERNQQRHNGDSTKNMVYVLVGAGVGAGVVIGGQIYSGERGYAGEIGHSPITLEATLKCEGCGKTGCLEMYTSGRAIARGASTFIDELPPFPTAEQEIRLAEQWGIIEQGGKRISAWQVEHAAEGGNAHANQIITKAASILGLSLVSIANLLDPAEIVLGGIGANFTYFQAAKAAFDTRRSNAGHTVIEFSRHKQEAPLLGAALWAITVWTSQ